MIPQPDICLSNARQAVIRIGNEYAAVPVFGAEGNSQLAFVGAAGIAHPEAAKTGCRLKDFPALVYSVRSAGEGGSRSGVEIDLVRVGRSRIGQRHALAVSRHAAKFQGVIRAVEQTVWRVWPVRDGGFARQLGMDGEGADPGDP